MDLRRGIGQRIAIDGLVQHRFGHAQFDLPLQGGQRGIVIQFGVGLSLHPRKLCAQGDKVKRPPRGTLGAGRARGLLP